MRELPSLPHTSPWFELSEFAKPNVKWCEASTSGVFAEPINTLSNLAYILAAMALIKYFSDKAKGPHQYFVGAILFLGIGSFIYHMTYSFVFQIFDFLGMFIIFSMMIGLNLIRAKRLTIRQFKSFFFTVLSINVGLFALFSALKIPVQTIIVALVVGTIVSEFLARKSQKTADQGYFSLALVSLVLAAAATALDVTRIACSPDSLIQGHSIWHLFTAISLFLMAKFYQKNMIN